MMQDAGIESIARQGSHDIALVVGDHVEAMMDIIRLELGTLITSNSDKLVGMSSYDAYNKRLKISMLQKELDAIGVLFKNRFGFSVDINVATRELTSITNVLMPALNYKTVNMALNDLEGMFPKKQANSILWESTSSKLEQNLHNTLNNLKKSIETGKFKLDLEAAKVRGLEESTFIMNVDILSATIVNLTPKEVTALLLQEVGHIFAYLEYMFTTTNNTLTLLDTFVHERFTKNQGPIESLTAAVNNTSVDVALDTSTPLTVLDSLDMFILKTYRIDKNRGSVRIDFNRMSDMFVSRMGEADALASALVKTASLGTIVKDKPEYRDTTSSIYKALQTLIEIMVFGMSIVVLGAFGIFVLVGAIGIKLAVFAISTVLDMILRLFGLLFSDNVHKDVTRDALPKRIKKLKIDLIRQLRQLPKNSNTKALLADQIDSVKETLSLIEQRMSITTKYGASYSNTNNYDRVEVMNELMEDLEENELHLLETKFNNLKGR